MGKTPIKCLPLQGFTPSFDFSDIPIKSMYKQSGNTVVVQVVKQIAKHIKDTGEYK
ncbi:MAG: DNA cytosine methyltransferase [Candidatus Fimenecus sp.]